MLPIFAALFSSEPGNQPMKTYAGIAMLVLALGILLMNLSDAVSDLHNWHDATTPQFVAVFMKQIGGVVVGAIGGNLLPTPGAK